MKKVPLLLYVLLLSSWSVAQSFLKPSLGLGEVPDDNESICEIPFYLGSFADSGIQEGDSAADFTIYGLNGEIFHLREELAKGKPVLLIAGNYTCPVFRKQIPSINEVINLYPDAVTTLIYYNVEAHPTDTSPYFGYVNVTSANQSAGILFPQPATYGERKNIAWDMLRDVSIPLLAPVFLDGPCNELWSFYGPAPNNAYLIDTNGRIFSKHAWYDKYPDNIICDIDSLLGHPSNCAEGPAEGRFTMRMLSSNRVYGAPGSTLSADLELINTSSSDVLVMMKRVVNNLADGWSSSMCADVCYSTATDSAAILIAKGDTQLFHFYFYTSDLQPDSSKSRVRFRNLADPDNVFTTDFMGFTSQDIGIKAISFQGLNLYPNPAENFLEVTSKDVAHVEICDPAGKMLLRSGPGKIDLSGLPAGLYLLRAEFHNRMVAVRPFAKASLRP